MTPALSTLGGAQVRPFLAAIARRTQQPLYLVTIHRADGSTESWPRVGGCTIDHSNDAMERAGLGGRVQVKRLEPSELEGLPA